MLPVFKEVRNIRAVLTSVQGGQELTWLLHQSSSNKCSHQETGSRSYLFHEHIKFSIKQFLANRKRQFYYLVEK